MTLQDDLKKILHYNPETGVFTRIARGDAPLKNPRIIDCKDGRGYLVCYFNNKNYKCHRLAFLYMEGRIPDLVDHIDGNPSNNKWSNLRACTTLENNHNRKLDSTSTTNIKGLTWYNDKKMHGYMARISVNYKRHSAFFGIAEHKTKERAKELAVIWLKNKREELHKEFTNHG